MSDLSPCPCVTTLRDGTKEDQQGLAVAFFPHAKLHWTIAPLYDDDRCLTGEYGLFEWTTGRYLLSGKTPEEVKNKGEKYFQQNGEGGVLELVERLKDNTRRNAHLVPRMVSHIHKGGKP